MHHNDLALDTLRCACTTLRKASRAATRFYDEVMADKGISIAQFATLRNIARGEPLPLMQLAEILVMDRTTLYRTLKPLQREGWIAIDAGAGRAKLVRLTSAGRKVMQEATAAWENAQNRLLGAVGMRQWSAIEKSLDRLIAAAQDGAT